MPAGAVTGRERRARLVAAVVACILVGTACASSDDSSTRASLPVDDNTPTSEAPVEVVFPGDEWERADPMELGFDPEALERIAADAEAAASSCLLVSRHGRVVGEWYWGGADASTAGPAFSATKSFASTLVGIAAADGLLDIDDPVAEYVPEWLGTDSEDVTIGNLLNNDSGRHLDPATDYGAFAAAPDKNAFTIGLDQEAAPGTTWGYNNAAIQVLDAVLQVATGTGSAEYARDQLLDPIGMADSAMSLDDAGNTMLYIGLMSTCGDMARFGHLFGQAGDWDGTQVVPRRWVEAATGAPSQRLNAAYGYLWWLNRPGPVAEATDALVALPADAIEEGQLVPGAPDDLYFAIGLGGQIIAVDPGSGTVVVRMGPVGSEVPFLAADTARVITEALVSP